jgi:hypothetical protein
LAISNSGAASTWGGSRLPAVNMIRSVMLNFQLTRLTAKAIMEARKRTSSTAGTLMITEFQKYLAKPPWVQAWTKLSKLKSPARLK